MEKISTLEVISLISAGANISLNSLNFESSDRKGFARLAARAKTRITFAKAEMIEHPERLTLIKSAPGLVHFDFS
ncbi:hypothetical protein [Pseudomonas grandcourensis]|uniref:hypothetical protein n=1 Tax=Pseudomonas grandcourensis TaxID=3136736 RepID=UPI003262F643